MEEQFDGVFSLNQIEEKGLEWLVEGIIPKGCITMVVGNNDIDAFLDNLSHSLQGTVLRFSTDGVKFVFKNMILESNLPAKFGCTELEQILEELRPDLCIFESCELFLPGVRHSRNAIREQITRIMRCAKETTFLIADSSKKTIVWDEVWNASRSVFRHCNGKDFVILEKTTYVPHPTPF